MCGWGLHQAITTWIRCAWGKFKELLPLLSSMSISWRRKGHLFDTVVRKAMLHASECWAPTKDDISRLNRTDRAMLRWICKVRLSDRLSSDTLLAKLHLIPLEDVLRSGRLRWYGHVTRSKAWINKVTKLNIQGNVPRGRPKKTWPQCVQEDLKLWKLTRTDPTERLTWRNNVQQRLKQRKPVEPVAQTTEQTT